jgi:hypothetical protein
MLCMCSTASETSVSTAAARIASFSAGAFGGKSATPFDGSFVSGSSFCPLRRQITKDAVTTIRVAIPANAAPLRRASNVSNTTMHTVPRPLATRI